MMYDVYTLYIIYNRNGGIDMLQDNIMDWYKRYKDNIRKQINQTIDNIIFSM